MTMDLVFRALRLAATKHRDQRRKDREASPYINHPIDVMAILAIEAGVDDPVTLAAAVLHDTVEDTETTIDELRDLFGDDVASVVAEVTDDQSLPREERYRLQREKAPHYSPRAKLIRLADKVSNLRDVVASPPLKWTPERIAGHRAQSRHVVDLLRGTHNELEALFDAVFAQEN